MLELRHGAWEKHQFMVAGRTRRLLVGQVILLGIILLVAAWLRIAGHNWDEGRQINVDELFVTKVTLKSINLPLDASLSNIIDPSLAP